MRYINADQLKQKLEELRDDGLCIGDDWEVAQASAIEMIIKLIDTIDWVDVDGVDRCG